jgi:hypothetical protein
MHSKSHRSRIKQLLTDVRLPVPLRRVLGAGLRRRQFHLAPRHNLGQELMLRIRMTQLSFGLHGFGLQRRGDRK